MIEQFDLVLLGIAVVIDSVLLMIVWERINRPAIATWMTNLILFTWIAHAAAFSHVLLRDATGMTLDLLDRCCLAVLGAGLLMMPPAMLHAALRLNHTGRQMRPAFDPRYGWLYSPLVLLPWVIQIVWTNPSRTIPECFQPLTNPCLWGMATMTLSAAILFLRYRSTIDIPNARHFFLQLAVILGTNAFLTIAFAWFGDHPFISAWLGVFVTLGPLLIALLFLWYSLREQILPLVIERSIAYGAILVLVILIHQVWIVPIAESMQRKSNLDFVLLEGIALIVSVLAWRPLRYRVLESLRYLLSRDVFQVREAVRDLSLKLSQQEIRSAKELTEWFKGEVINSLLVGWAEIWPLGEQANAVDAPERSYLEPLFHRLTAKGRSSLARDEMAGECEELIARDCSIVFRWQFKDLQGLVLLGPRSRAERFSEEQVTSLAILFDQFAATLYNRMVERERLQAERQASQQEKLAVLGLMTGALAHEIKNPLSSIRTIASLLREESKENPIQSKDLGIILEEIDRLTATTQRMLEYSKPPDEKKVGIDVHRLISRLFHILLPWARQLRVELNQILSAEAGLVRATDSEVSEILFNLLRNAVEAVQTRAQGQVWIATRVADGQFVISVRDNGPGIDPAIRDTIYRAFVTSKEYGTGLGLYIAAERVRSIGGSLDCESSHEGTTFLVRLPLMDPKF